MSLRNCEDNTNWAKLYCIRFNFCLPLEDIFPPCDIHPKLKKLLQETYESVLDSDLSIKFILSSQLQGSVNDRLSFKDSLVSHSQLGYLTTEPGIYLWTVRHFLGLLPIQLLPSYTDNTYFQWFDHGKACRIYFKIHKKCSVNTFKLDANIARSIENLPFANYLLLHYLMHLFRKIVKAKKDSSGKGGCYLSQYFYQAIFLRPYMPASFQTDNNTDHNYFYLLWYMIIKWPFIEQKIDFVVKPNELTLNPPLSNNHKCNLSKTNHEDDFNNDYLKDVAIQTDSIDEKPLSEFIFPSQDEFNTLTTDLNETLFKPARRESKTWDEIRRETSETVKKLEEYIFDDYETFEKESFNQIPSQSTEKNNDKNKEIFEPISQSSPKDAGNPPISEISLSESNKIQKKCSKSNDSIQNLYKITAINESDKSIIGDDLKKESVVEKVSKMGWTYTPSVNQSPKNLADLEESKNEKADKSLTRIWFKNRMQKKRKTTDYKVI